MSIVYEVSGKTELGLATEMYVNITFCGLMPFKGLSWLKCVMNSKVRVTVEKIYNGGFFLAYHDLEGKVRHIPLARFPSSSGHAHLFHSLGQEHQKWVSKLRRL